MYSIQAQNSFKKDLKLALKRGFKIELLQEVLKILERDGDLPLKFKPHKLIGNYKGLWECHVKPDWLLIYDKDEDIKLISLIRTGTHSDLFK